MCEHVRRVSSTYMEAKSSAKNLPLSLREKANKFVVLYPRPSGEAVKATFVRHKGRIENYAQIIKWATYHNQTVDHQRWPVRMRYNSCPGALAS